MGVNADGGFGMIGFLQVVFVALKLFGAIDWSWWWVLFPGLFVIGFFGFIFSACAIGLLIEGKLKRGSRRV